MTHTPYMQEHCIDDAGLRRLRGLGRDTTLRGLNTVSISVS